MPAKTKYSRSSWKKTQLRQSMNVPNLGETGCSLCYDRSIPSNLNTHVSDYQTCADVHLQLALLRYNNAMCAVGQEQYQDICCPRKKKAAALKTTAGFMIGAILIAYLARKVFGKSCSSGKGRRVKDRDGTVSSDDDSNGSLPTTQTSGTHGSSRGEVGLEMPTSRYLKMEELDAPPIKTSRSKLNSSRSRSRGRPQSRPRPRSPAGDWSSSRPRSRSRGDRGISDRTSASSERQQSRSRGIFDLANASSGRQQSRSRGDRITTEHPHALSARPHSRSRGDRSVSDRPHSRSRGDHGISERHQSRSRDRRIAERPQSRSRGERSIPDRNYGSRTRPRSKSPTTASRSTSRSRSKSRDRRRAEADQHQQYHNPHHERGNYRRDPYQQSHRHLPSEYYEYGYHTEGVEDASRDDRKDLTKPTLLL